MRLKIDNIEVGGPAAEIHVSRLGGQRVEIDKLTSGAAQEISIEPGEMISIVIAPANPP